MTTKLLRRALALAAVLAVACASPSLRQADTYFSSRSYRQAIRAYETYLHTQPQAKEIDRVLFHLALAHTLAEPARPSVQTAEKLFERLVKDFPASPYSPQARLILDLQSHLETLRQDLATRAEFLVHLLADAEEAQESLRRLAGEKDGEIDRLDAQLTALRQKLEHRTAEIATREEKIARLERELRALKRIDTGGAAP